MSGPVMGQSPSGPIQQRALCHLPSPPLMPTPEQVPLETPSRSTAGPGTSFQIIKSEELLVLKHSFTTITENHRLSNGVLISSQF